MNYRKMDKQITNSTLNDFYDSVDHQQYHSAVEDINTILQLKYVGASLLNS